MKSLNTLILSSFYRRSLTYVLSYMCLCLMFFSARAILKLPPNQTIPAVIVFGDFIVDTGNNNYIPTLIKCNFPPYGKDFPGGIPTGRFCDGKVPSDMIENPIKITAINVALGYSLRDLLLTGEQLGIKSTIPSYLDPSLHPEDLSTGVSFASGGTGYDPMTPKIVSAISLSEQISYFKEYIGKLQNIVGEDKTNFILANSLYLVVAGSDDIANTYFTARVRQLRYDVPEYTSFMASLALDFLKELYDMGARRIAVFSAPPIGCVPSQRTLAGGAMRECAENYNKAAQLFNTKLSSELDSLNSKLPQSRIVYIDVYNPLLSLILYPEKYGFSVVEKGCCGTGNIEVTLLCNKLAGSCSDVSNYIFWDSYHPTEKAYKILIRSLLKKYLNKLF